MRQATIEKYLRVHQRFAELYTVERLRLDDCEAQLSKEFFISIITIRRILKIDLTTPYNI